MSVVPTSEIEILRDVKVPMRDGVALSTDVFMPAAGGPFPTVLARTPYNRAAHVPRGEELARRGCAFVSQDCRGRFGSEGEFYPWHNEADDGRDAQAWIAKQPWCNGRIGMVGGSYVGLVQWLSAVRGHEALKCIVPRVCTSNFYDSPNYSGGAFQLALNMLWGFRMGLGPVASDEDEGIDWPLLFRTLPLMEADQAVGLRLAYWRDWVSHPEYDDYWDAVSVENKYHLISVPALIMGGWYDLYAKQVFTNFKGMRERGGSEEARACTRLIVGPWPHPLSASPQTGELDFGPDSLLDLMAIEEEFLERWLLGAGSGTAAPPMRLFIMGANVWREECEWPLARTQWTRFYLHSKGNANSLSGDGALSTRPPGAEPADRFVYDPEDPAPTLGGANCCRPDVVPWGPYDQRPVEARPDVLVYTTPPLERDVEATGPIAVKLYASSSAPDTDFTAKLVDVFPDGRAMNLCDGIIRARYRRSFDQAVLMERGEVCEFDIDCWVTGNVFLKGHCIRLEVSSSNFPRFDRNPNTGRPFGRDAALAKATQTVFHTRERPSHVVLPVIPSGGRPGRAVDL